MNGPKIGYTNSKTPITFKKTFKNINEKERH